jgi:hypothetical protein
MRGNVMWGVRRCVGEGWVGGGGEWWRGEGEESKKKRPGSRVGGEWCVAKGEDDVDKKRRVDGLNGGKGDEGKRANGEENCAGGQWWGGAGNAAKCGKSGRQAGG